MNCSWHPNKRAVAACKECGAEFCIECVRETDQTTLCPECYRRRSNEIALEFTEPAELAEEESAGSASLAAREGLPLLEPLPADETPDPSAAAEEKSPVGEGKETAPEMLAAELPADDFLSRGPDGDFSRLADESKRLGRRTRGRKREDAAEREEKQSALTAEGEADKVRAASFEDRLLRDVVSTLLKPETEAGAGTAAAGRGGAVAETGDALAARKEARRREARERWSFLAQPRSSEHTLIATSWWRAAIFVALMLLLGAVLWAVPNVFILGDSESGFHAVLVGLVLGLAFWWKAGKRHGTKLAVQAAATTLFALIIGEFLHWFLTIVRYKAFREIFFDLVSFRFLWQNGREILENIVEAMFPVAFIWLLLLPTAVAFIVGFGMPPIPEIFVQFWSAVRGRVPGEKGASHGVEG